MFAVDLWGEGCLCPSAEQQRVGGRDEGCWRSSSINHKAELPAWKGKPANISLFEHFQLILLGLQKYKGFLAFLTSREEKSSVMGTCAASGCSCRARQTQPSHAQSLRSPGFSFFAAFQPSGEPVIQKCARRCPPGLAWRAGGGFDK